MVTEIQISDRINSPLNSICDKATYTLNATKQLTHHNKERSQPCLPDLTAVLSDFHYNLTSVLINNNNDNHFNSLNYYISNIH